MLILQWFKITEPQSNYASSRELKQRCFWATNAKRKWTFCNLGKWCCPNFRPNLPYERKRHSRIEIWQRQGILKWKMPHFRLTCVAQKRLCFNSLLSPAEFTAQFARKVCSSSGAQIFGTQIVHTKEFGGRLPLSSTKCFLLLLLLPHSPSFSASIQSYHSYPEDCAIVEQK